jgi:glycosyltransferase involved in cell wall biosynthesis
MKEKILCIVQLPPPVHGASLMNESFVGSALINEHYDLKTIDIATAKNIGDIGKMSLKKIGDSIVTLFRIASVLRRFRPRLVYFTFSPTGFAFYRDAVYVLLVKRSGAGLVIHLHGKGLAAGAKDNTIRKWITGRVLQDASVISLSRTLTADISPFPHKNGFIVNCGIPLATVPVLSPSKDRNPSGKTRLLFLSNYVRTKGILDLIDAIEIVAGQTRDFDVHLVGRPYDISIGDLTEYSKRKGLDDLITIRGPRYGEEKDLEFRQAGIFVFPTYYPNEAFPLVLLEAMQWGLPCITTREGGIPDIIEDGVTGYVVNQRDIGSLADKILFLIQHPEKKDSMGAAARKIFLERFTIGIFEMNMLRTFEGILNKQSGL